LAGVCVDLRAGEITELDSIGTIDLFADDRDLLFDGQVEIIEEFKAGGAFTACNNCFSECAATCTSFGPVIADDSCIRPTTESLFANESKLRRGISPNYD